LLQAKVSYWFVITVMSPDINDPQVFRIFPDLTTYMLHGHFAFKPGDRLTAVCNAPPDQSGIYLVFGRNQQGTSLLYVGTSGGRGITGNILHRKGGMRNRILSGRQFGGRRPATWPVKMKETGIEELRVHWFVTWDAEHRDFPKEVAAVVLKKYRLQQGGLPAWNAES
jgi:hypothetical protein